MIKVIQFPENSRNVLGFNYPIEVVGCVNNREVFKLSNHIGGKWHVASSSCFPSDINLASDYKKCIDMVWERAATLGLK